MKGSVVNLSQISINNEKIWAGVTGVIMIALVTAFALMVLTAMNTSARVRTTAIEAGLVQCLYAPMGGYATTVWTLPEACPPDPN